MDKMDLKKYGIIGRPRSCIIHRTTNFPREYQEGPRFRCQMTDRCQNVMTGAPHGRRSPMTFFVRRDHDNEIWWTDEYKNDNASVTKAA